MRSCGTAAKFKQKRLENQRGFSPFNARMNPCRDRSPIIYPCRKSLCYSVRRYSSGPIPTVGRAHGIVQLTGDHFSKELALLLLDIPWAMIEGLQTDRESPPGEK